MSEPKTQPQSFAIQVQTAPNPAHSAWIERIEQLLAEFERGTPESQREPLALGFVLLAADHLWDKHAEQADFARLDVAGFVAHCEALLRSAGVMHSFGRALSAFYEFLSATGRVDSERAAALAGQFRTLCGEPEPCS